jgi:hypothetical protein
MTLEQLEKEKPEKITVDQAAAIMGVTPQFLRIALQHNKFPFGTAVKFKRWSYYINTERFIKYMKGEIA